MLLQQTVADANGETSGGVKGAGAGGSNGGGVGGREAHRSRAGGFAESRVERLAHVSMPGGIGPDEVIDLQLEMTRSVPDVPVAVAKPVTADSEGERLVVLGMAGVPEMGGEGMGWAHNSFLQILAHYYTLTTRLCGFQVAVDAALKSFASALFNAASTPIWQLCSGQWSACKSKLGSAGLST